MKRKIKTVGFILLVATSQILYGQTFEDLNSSAIKAGKEKIYQLTKPNIIRI